VSADRDNQLSTDVAAFVEPFLELEGAASEPYNRFCYGTPEFSDRLRRHLLLGRAAEYCPPAGRLLIESGSALGLLACLSGADLRKARLGAALALARSSFLREDASLEPRIRLAGRALLKVQPDDYYLSRLAVRPESRGTGVASALLAIFEREGRERGSRRLVLEVSPESTAAVRLYQRHGFLEVGRGSASDPETGRSLEYAHLTKQID
jgi:ribosomal protein S18 acetylase RimI-like enzyme